MKRPVIGICSRLTLGGYSSSDNNIPVEKDGISCEYTHSVYDAGGLPIVLPLICDEDLIDAYISKLDGLLVPGGEDVNPLTYGEEPLALQGFAMQELDDFDLICIKKAFERKIPIFGICRGIQIINTVFGGTLYQDISYNKECFVKHRQLARRYYPNHTVNIEKDSKLYNVLGDVVVTNSYHHQAVKDIAPGFKATARAKDGIIEGLEYEGDQFVMAVQWHPEMMYPKHENMRKLFSYFIDKCMI